MQAASIRSLKFFLFSIFCHLKKYWKVIKNIAYVRVQFEGMRIHFSIKYMESISIEQAAEWPEEIYVQ